MSVSTTMQTKQRRAKASAINAPAGWTPWVRPADWLALPDVTGLQRFVGLHRIDKDGNFLALSATAAYTVDWGDGTTNNSATGVTAYKQYDYSTIASTGESTLGYRQVIVQVYPQSGQNLVTLSLNVKHNQSGLGAYTGGFLDIAVNGANMTFFAPSGSTVNQTQLQNAYIGDGAYSNGPSFYNCSALRSVYIRPSTTASSTGWANAFNNCYSLEWIPYINTASTTSLYQTFIGCSSLLQAPVMDTKNATSLESCFQSCVSMVSVPTYDTAKVTNFFQTHQGNASLRSGPAYNTAAATNMSGMFFGCNSLQSLPTYNTSKVTNMGNAFRACPALTSVPAMDTSKVTDMSFMFGNSSALKEVPALSTALVTNMSNMFNACTSLTTVPAINATAVTSGNHSQMFLSCPSLSSVAMTNINQTISFASCKLSAAQINAIFGNLSATGSGKTVTVTGNYGASTCDTTIATAKGWTVVT